ncbi:hypothetical protein SynRS9902_01221 [Synechococcus sp. RS9902]|nr:hypothetical protein SynRS9902_01221 [Synechococcus sp. RS9902]
MDRPNSDVRPVRKDDPAVGLSKQIATLVIRTKTDSAGTSLLILRS